MPVHPRSRILHPRAAARPLQGARYASRGSAETAVWRVEIAAGGQAPSPHQLTREEVFIVLSGRARLRIGAEVLEAREGDAIVVPANTDFALWSATEQPVQALCCLPVGGQARIGGQVFTPPWAE